MIALLLALTALTAPFPLPSVDGKPVAVSDKQKTFRVPMRFEKVKAFYAAQLSSAVARKETQAHGKRVLTLSTSDKHASWTRAVVREGEVDTTIDVTPVMRLADEEISGTAGPLVQFVFGRSGEVEKALHSIDHTDELRK